MTSVRPGPVAVIEPAGIFVLVPDEPGILGGFLSKAPFSLPVMIRREAVISGVTFPAENIFLDAAPEPSPSRYACYLSNVVASTSRRDDLARVSSNHLGGIAGR